MNRDQKSVPARAHAKPMASQTAAAKLQAQKQQKRKDQQEWLIDEALAETFPASDPISPSIIK
jgi:hypothetical protein